jgi:hypothetical protein
MATSVYTVLGDLVASRALPDRGAVHTSLAGALEEVNQALRPVLPFAPTVGDEYQGACDRLSDAVLAALLVRLALLPSADVRCGLGHGPVTVYDATRRPPLQDGPGWWTAREAIEAIGGAREARRTWLVGGPDDDPAQAGLVNAFLVCRDQLVDRVNDRGVRMLRMALLGRSQKDIAEAEGVWPSAVSQQFSRGVGAVVQAQRLIASSADGAFTGT